MKKVLILLLALITVFCAAACTDETNPTDVSVKPNESETVSTPENTDKSESVSENASENASSDVSEDESHDHSHGSVPPSDNSESSTPSTKIPEPMALVGTWKRISTEVEGDINDGGDCTIIITGTNEENLKITYTDKNHPDTNYSDKELILSEQKYFPEYGNGEWVACVYHFGPNDTTYCLAIFEDGKLKLRNDFVVDGALCYSYEIFERA